MVSIQQTDPQVARELRAACGDDPSWLCERVFRATGSTGWAQATDDVLARPAKILLVVAVAFLAHLLIRRAINRFTAQIADPHAQERLRRMRSRAPAAVVETGVLSLRSAARAQTLAHVMRSITAIAIWLIAAVTILGELGVYLGPLIAGAGIAGVAIGFGAQSLVKDFLSGVFMLVEDQYGVGDIIDAGAATGTVEAVSLRTTRLRDVNGTVWHIPNGAIERVGNKSQQWARALLDISVAYGTDVDRVQRVIKEIADGLWRDPEWEGRVLEEPEVWGIEQLGPDAMVVRLVVKTQPAAQFAVMRELRRRLSDAFYREGVEAPATAPTVGVPRDAGSSRDGTDGPAPIHEAVPPTPADDPSTPPGTAPGASRPIR